MKTAIVTGASDGLGQKIAEKLLTKGWKVISLSRTKPGLDIVHIKADLADEQEIEKAIKKIKADYPNFDCLINCAGVINVVPLENIDYRDMENLFKTNVVAPIRLVSGLLENIKNNEADIVNVGSTVGFKPFKDQIAYSSSKWALRGVTENLQLELKDTKCRVIGFNPGGMKTKFFEKAKGKVDLSPYMDTENIADLLVYILETPKQMEVSQIIINRKI